MSLPLENKLTRLVALFTLLLLSVLIAGGWYSQGRIRLAFEKAHLDALEEEGRLIARSIKGQRSPDLEGLRIQTGFDELARFDMQGLPFEGDPGFLPSPGSRLMEDLDLESEKREVEREGDEIFLRVRVPLMEEEGYLLLVGGYRLSSEIVELRNLLWVASGLAALFSVFLLSSLAGILRRAQLRQRELDRAGHLARIGTLAAGLAHEIRNPLAIIFGQAEWIESRSEGDESRRAAEILEESERMQTLLEDFLHYARPMDLQKQELNPDDFSRECLEKSRAMYPGCEFQLKSPGRIPEVLADPGKLRQVFFNLLGNAADACKSGRVEVELAVDRKALRVLVRDEGPGVSSGLLPRLFEPFHSGKEGGTGLGLAISRSIARAHGGELALLQPGPGNTCFELRLPLKKGKA